MSDDAVSQIAKEQKRRHAHNENQPACRNCGSYISMPTHESGQVRVQCTACGRWQLRYVNPKTSATSD